MCSLGEVQHSTAGCGTGKKCISEADQRFLVNTGTVWRDHTNWLQSSSKA